jgi:hypothetical protein
LGGGGPVVKIRTPTWRLRATCPVCEQGGCLALLSCPACDRVVAVCEEESAVYLDPRNLVPAGDGPERLACPGCGNRRVAEFVVATDTTIQSAGFTVVDYE